MTHTIEHENDGAVEVLTIRDRQGCQVVIGFTRDGDPHGVGIRTRGLTRVIGEDLTRLRDMILSLPESAFPEIPYVSEHGWVEGDIVHYQTSRGENLGATYVRNAEGIWDSSWNQDYPESTPCRDQDIDAMLERGLSRGSGQAKHVALRKAGRFVA